MKSHRSIAIVGCLSLTLLLFPLQVSAISLPDNSSCNTSSTNGCFRITNTNATGKAITGVVSGSSAAVTGTSSGVGIGVSGSSASGQGVYGFSSSDEGVRGNSTTGTGVVGTVTAGSGNGVLGATAGTASGNGVKGTSSNGASGVYGENTGSGGFGVAGRVVSTGNGIAVYGDSGFSGSALAGLFDGKVVVNGDIFANSFMNNSDQRLKTSIAEMKIGLAETLKLRPVTYKWTKDGNSGTTQLGLIAQDVQKVIPTIVGENGSGGTLTVNYVALLPVAIKAIQEQQQVIEKQEARIAFLERSRGPAMSSTLSGGLGIAAVLGMVPLGIIVVRRRRKTDVSDSR
jgi:hypothetical protein